jgi:hypothetical protein
LPRLPAIFIAARCVRWHIHVFCAAEAGPMRHQQCPACHGKSVRRIDGAWGRRTPTHLCPDCGAGLCTVLTRRWLWSIPVLAGSLAVAYLSFAWLQQAQVLSGAALAGAHGGLFAAAFAASAKAALNGIEYRIWAP